MIVRFEGDGRMLLIAQTDHSRLAGQFAAHWGNDTFAPLAPYESVVRAATFHDFGYLRYETVPAFDPQTGGTPMFRDVLTDPTRLDEYRWCFEWLLEPDPYAAMLVNMHRTGLWRQRYDTIASSIHRVRKQSDLVEDFIAHHEAERPAIVARHGWDRAQLWTNYRLLQAWDLLSLYFSCQTPAEDRIGPVPTAYGGGEQDGVGLTLTPTSALGVLVDPYPFDVDPLRVMLPARRLSSERFETQDAFRKAYFQAPIELITFELASAATRGTASAEPAFAGARPG